VIVVFFRGILLIVYVEYILLNAFLISVTRFKLSRVNRRQWKAPFRRVHDDVSEVTFADIALGECKWIAKVEKHVVLCGCGDPIRIFLFKVEQHEESFIIMEEAVRLGLYVRFDLWGHYGQKDDKDGSKHAE
jgi:hypothetical protein